MTRVEVLVQAAAMLVLTVTVSIPLSIYCGYQLFNHWNQQYFVKRKRTIILISYLLLCYSLLVAMSSSAIRHFVNQPSWIREFMFLSAEYCTQLMLTLLTLRVYLLHYDHKYNNTIQTQKWKILIDPSIAKTCWFLINKRKYGNDKYLMRRIVPLMSLYYITFVMVRIFAHLIVPIFAGMLLCAIEIIIIIYFWRKYPSFNDKLYIRQEIKFTFVTFVVATITLIIAFVTFSSLGLVHKWPLQFVIGLNVVLYITILYPIRANETAEVKKADKKRRSTNSTYCTQWQNIVSTQDGFESFASFLEKELSTENLLFVTEYIQLKTKMMENQGLKDKILIELDLKFKLDLPETISLSLIAQQFENSMMDASSNVNSTCFDGMRKIYNKYIDPSNAILEVNISSQKRKALCRIFDNNKNDTIDHLMICKSLKAMEAAATEISLLMNDSNTRFKQKTVFAELALANVITAEATNEF